MGGTGAAREQRTAGALGSWKGKIANTATTSSEFKKCIQPIMDGHEPTMVNIQWGSIVLFHMSLWNEPIEHGATPQDEPEAIARDLPILCEPQGQQ